MQWYVFSMNQPYNFENFGFVFFSPDINASLMSSV